MEQLVATVQALSLTRDLDTVMRIVRTAARTLTGADGATFVLREGDFCYYADEDAITPLWKGSRFPMNTCISGWAMLHRNAAVIEDIYEDERIPIEAYKPTFVKSLVMVPIRTIDPMGAIGIYWAKRHIPTPEEVKLLQALADSTAVTLENVNVYSELEQKLKERTTMLEHLTNQNQQLEDFCHIISHNLRAPLANLSLMSDMIDGSKTTDEKLVYVEKLKPVIDFLHETFEQLVDASQTRMDFSIERHPVNLGECLQKNIVSLQAEIQVSHAEIISDFSEANNIIYPRKYIDSIVFNLLHNALRYRSPDRNPKIRFKTYTKNGWVFLEVKDNGLGLDLNKNGNKLFKLRKTFHDHPDAKGFGLFITKTQIETMGGKIWAQSIPDKETIFTVQLYKM